MTKTKSDCITMRGIVIDNVRDTFRVRLENDALIYAKPSGKLRVNNIRLLRGDTVTVELSVYDLTKGRIIYREKASMQQI